MNTALAPLTLLLSLIPALDTGDESPRPEDVAETVWEYLEIKYDADKDGRVSKAEYTRDEEHWKRLDKNADGFLDKAELRGTKSRDRSRDRSRGNKRAIAPKVGQKAPDFTLVVLPEKSAKDRPQQEKKEEQKSKAELVSLSAFAKKKRPVALIFGSYT
jgi:hypothetical protein